jgi:translocation and assembly module TamB
VSWPSRGALTRGNLALDLAGNRLTARGRYGRPGDALELHVDAPALAALGHGLGGRIKADGVFRGTLAQPAGELAVLGDKLAAGGLRIDAVNGQGRIGAGRGGELSLQLALAGLRSGSDAEVLVRRASLVLTGPGRPTAPGSRFMVCASIRRSRPWRAVFPMAPAGKGGWRVSR